MLLALFSRSRLRHHFVSHNSGSELPRCIEALLVLFSRRTPFRRIHACFMLSDRRIASLSLSPVALLLVLRCVIFIRSCRLRRSLSFLPLPLSALGAVLSDGLPSATACSVALA